MVAYFAFRSSLRSSHFLTVRGEKRIAGSSLDIVDLVGNASRVLVLGGEFEGWGFEGGRMMMLGLVAEA